MATRSSIINSNRNPSLTQAQIEAAMCAAYGAVQVIWFTGISNQDITDDHVDATSRFIASGGALVQSPDWRTSPTSGPRTSGSNTRSCRHRRTRRARRLTSGNCRTGLAQDRQLREPGFVDDYVNYYVCNGAVISAQFGDAHADAAARRTLAATFPDGRSSNSTSTT